MLINNNCYLLQFKDFQNTGFFLLDSINSLKTSQYNKLFIFDAFVLSFDYKYNFTTKFSLRMKKPRINEIFVTFDFGLKSLCKLNSKELYTKNKYLFVSTFDRFLVSTFLLESNFLEVNSSSLVFPWNKSVIFKFFSWHLPKLSVRRKQYLWNRFVVEKFKYRLYKRQLLKLYRKKFNKLKYKNLYLKSKRLRHCFLGSRRILSILRPIPLISSLFFFERAFFKNIDVISFFSFNFLDYDNINSYNLVSLLNSNKNHKSKSIFVTRDKIFKFIDSLYNLDDNNTQFFNTRRFFFKSSQRNCNFNLIKKNKFYVYLRKKQFGFSLKYKSNNYFYLLFSKLSFFFSNINLKADYFKNQFRRFFILFGTRILFNKQFSSRLLYLSSYRLSTFVYLLFKLARYSKFNVYTGYSFKKKLLNNKSRKFIFVNFLRFLLIKCYSKHKHLRFIKTLKKKYFFQQLTTSNLFKKSSIRYKNNIFYNLKKLIFKSDFFRIKFPKWKRKKVNKKLYMTYLRFSHKSNNFLFKNSFKQLFLKILNVSIAKHLFKLFIKNYSSLKLKWIKYMYLMYLYKKTYKFSHFKILQYFRKSNLYYDDFWSLFYINYLAGYFNVKKKFVLHLINYNKLKDVSYPIYIANYLKNNVKFNFFRKNISINIYKKKNYIKYFSFYKSNLFLAKQVCVYKDFLIDDCNLFNFNSIYFDPLDVKKFYFAHYINIKARLLKFTESLYFSVRRLFMYNKTIFKKYIFSFRKYHKTFLSYTLDNFYKLTDIILFKQNIIFNLSKQIIFNYIHSSFEFKFFIQNFFFKYSVKFDFFVKSLQSLINFFFSILFKWFIYYTLFLYSLSDNINIKISNLYNYFYIKPVVYKTFIKDLKDELNFLSSDFFIVTKTTWASGLSLFYSLRNLVLLNLKCKFFFNSFFSHIFLLKNIFLNKTNYNNNNYKNFNFLQDIISFEYLEHSLILLKNICNDYFFYWLFSNYNISIVLTKRKFLKKFNKNLLLATNIGLHLKRIFRYFNYLCSMSLNSIDYGLKDLTLSVNDNILFLDQQDYDDSFFNLIYTYKTNYKFFNFLQNIYFSNSTTNANNFRTSFFFIYHISFNVYSLNKFFLFLFLNKLKNKHSNITCKIILNVFDCLYSNTKNKFNFEKNNVIPTKSLFLKVKNRPANFY